MFDMLSISQGVFDELRAVLQAASITKIMHDCRQDSAALSSQHNVTLQDLIHRSASDCCNALHASSIACTTCCG